MQNSYRFILTGFSFLLLLSSCGSMFDVTGRGAKDKKVFYNVEKNVVTCNYKKPMSSIYIRQRKNDSTLTYIEIPLDTPAKFINIPLSKDSIALYDSYIWIHLQDDHWRTIFHIDITRSTLKKKRKIYSRVTDH